MVKYFYSSYVQFCLILQKILFQGEKKVVDPQSSFHLEWWNTWLENFFEPIHIIFVLEQFIFKPENFEKKSNVSRAANKELGEPSRVSDVSSAYWEIYVLYCEHKCPLYFYLVVQARISTQRRNRYGAIGSPCLQPLSIWNCYTWDTLLP